MKLVAIVGRPNVGKSTIFNRLIGERKALVHDMPGVTRDRNYGKAEWMGRTFGVVDTGGFEPDSDEGMLPLMRKQAQLAIDEADVIVFVVDARTGLNAADEQVFGVLRQSSRPIVVAVNKVDSAKQINDTMEFYALGIDQFFPTSAEHNLGMADLIEAMVEALPGSAEEDEGTDDGRIRIAIVGRPNSGKSTLINRLLGADRLITSDVAGTTRDTIDSDLDVGDKRYTLVDTAGIRRRRYIDFAVEKFGVIKAIQGIERAHVAVLMLDSAEAMTDQDARIANIALDAGRPLVIVFNKWDLVEKGDKTSAHMLKELHRTRPTLAIAPVQFVSALTGRRATKILDLVDQVHENWNRRISTGHLNQWFEDLMRHSPPPLYKKRAMKLYYTTQAKTRPPTFVAQSNMPPESMSESYKRFLASQLREAFDFSGTPIRIFIRQRTSRFQD
ncbi:MAG: GTP-binding protein [Myxococcota bacterium]|jgi:GTP-binding protein